MNRRYGLVCRGLALAFGFWALAGFIYHQTVLAYVFLGVTVPLAGLAGWSALESRRAARRARSSDQRTED